MSRYDVVLTTYGTLVAEMKNSGPLLSASWYRIILGTNLTLVFVFLLIFLIN